jgi:hypothetical protein
MSSWALICGPSGRQIYQKGGEWTLLGDLGVELDRIRHEVSAVMDEANPALKRRVDMIMATVWLGVIELRIRAAPDPEKRRELINEFWRRRNTIEKVVQGYRKILRHRVLPAEQEPRRAVP